MWFLKYVCHLYLYTMSVVIWAQLNTCDKPQRTHDYRTHLREDRRCILFDFVCKRHLEIARSS